MTNLISGLKNIRLWTLEWNHPCYLSESICGFADAFFYGQLAYRIGRACGGIIFFNTASFRSGVYRMTFILLRPNNNAF
jgi:hypothetical protein